MFPEPSELLRPQEGTLSEAPLPLLLHALTVESRSCALELRARGVEKRVFFENGAPVACASNLLHETLGMFLVERKKLSEEQRQLGHAEAARLGSRVGEVVVQRGWLSPYELYKQMQAALAHKILDCFRWTEGSYRLLTDAPPVDTAVKMNPVKLILTGVESFLPLDVITACFPFTEQQRFALSPNPPHSLEELKLSAKETRFLQLLRQGPRFSEMVSRLGLDTEPLLRRLFAFAVLGFVRLASEEERPVASAPAVASEPVSPPPPPEIDEQTRNALVTAFLSHRVKDPLELLGLAEDFKPEQLRRAFLSLADRFSPSRFPSQELREKAEELLLAYARAYGALSDPEQLALVRKRRQVAAEASKSGPRPGPGDTFRIATSLLDAGSQFAEGKKRMQAANYRGALEYFQYAYDLEPKPQFRAYLAWARYQLNPSAHGRLALSELEAAAAANPDCEEAHAFAAEIYRAIGQFAKAEASFQRAFRANPKNRRYGELATEMARRGR